MKPQLTYSEAIAELEKILAELESSEETNMEHISKLVKRATELMVFCKRTLHELDEELEKAIEGIGE